MYSWYIKQCLVLCIQLLEYSCFHLLKTYKNNIIKTISTLRCQLGAVKLIFMDEIAVVGDLHVIHKTCMEIKLM